MLDVRVAQSTLENTLRDAILFALGRRLPAVASVAALRAAVTRGASGSERGDDDLISIVVGGVVTAAYRWNSISTAADNGTTIIKPTDVSTNGRWLAWTSPLRIAPIAGGNSQYLHEALTGPIQRVIVIDKDSDKDDITNLLTGAIPGVAIDARGDAPEALEQNVGRRWDTSFDFTIYVITENLHDSRQAAQGSSVPNDLDTLGANGLDGLIWSLLAGDQLYAVVDGIRDVQVGRGANWMSELGQRRVIRSREYTIRATVDNPPAPNDAGAVQELDAQFYESSLDRNFDPANLTNALNQTSNITPGDPNNVIVSGMIATLGVGLSKTVSAGSAMVAGSLVNYAGALITFAASSDTYRDLKADGTMLYTAVTVGGDEPPLAVGSLRVGVTTTDASGVNDDRYLAAAQTAYGSDIYIPIT